MRPSQPLRANPIGEETLLGPRATLTVRTLAQWDATIERPEKVRSIVGHGSAGFARSYPENMARVVTRPSHATTVHAKRPTILTIT